MRCIYGDKCEGMAEYCMDCEEYAYEDGHAVCLITGEIKDIELMEPDDHLDCYYCEVCFDGEPICLHIGRKTEIDEFMPKCPDYMFDNDQYWKNHEAKYGKENYWDERI